jgi:Holliday junction resolvasome RuvABC endonuclease subunit|tara:strand:+ start:942 stop:1475 length:534 start_codon:yes stop_codon:yes gene_type:complete
MNILGLDISTSITGVTVIDDSGAILYCESIDTRNKNHFSTLLHKAEHIKNKLKELKYEYDINYVFIEESLQSFRSGFSSAKTLSTLSKINGIVSYLAYDIFNLMPLYLSATSARKSCGIKVPRGQKAKEVVLNFLLDSEPKFVIEYTRHGNPCPGSYDRADSVIIARAGLEYCKQKN